MYTRIALSAVCFTLLFAQAADAGVRVDASRKIAAKFWNYHVPVEVRWEDPENVGLSVGAEGWVNTAYPNTIFLSVYGGFTWHALCSVMLHEYGHLAGYRNEANPSDPIHDPPGSGTVMSSDGPTPDVCVKYPKGIKKRWYEKTRRERSNV